MIKRTLVFILIIFSFQFSFSQEETITPVHIIKLDVFKSTFSQLHFDYERYNGKRGAVEFGLSFFYRNPALVSIDEGGMHRHNLYAFQYTGYGFELKRKFYFPGKHVYKYLAPELSAKYKYFNDKDVLLYGDRESSEADWNVVSRQMYQAGLNIVVGIISKPHKGVILDFNAGAGIGYVDVNTQITNYRHYYDAQIAGRDAYTVLQLQLSAKLCFGFNGKTKKA